MFNVKNRGKVFAVAALLFFVGIFGMAVSHTKPAYAAGNASSTVGYVNYQLLVSQHPDTAKAQDTMNAAIAQANSDFDAKSANMSDQDKQALYQQLQQGLQQKQAELLAPINDKIMAAIKSVADAKGLTTIVDKSSIIYGGQDITDDVIKAITQK